MTKEQKVIGICLKSTDYKEHDKIIHIFSPNGKITALAKGVKKKNAKLKSVCQPFCIGEYILTYKGDFAVVTNASLLDSNYEILNDYSLYETASIGLKMAYDLSYQIQNDCDLYELLLIFLNELKNNQENMYKHIINMFVINLLSISGYAINEKVCALCSKQLKEGAFFNEMNGNFYCQSCVKDSKNIISRPCIEYISHPNALVDKSIIDESYIILIKLLKIYMDFNLNFF